MFSHSAPSYASQQTWFKLPAFSAAFIEKQIEDGDKIILPPSVLDSIMQRYTLSLPHPLLFEINNNASHRTSHCGVLEFSSPDASAYLPHWMMQNLLCEEGKELRLRIKSLPRGLEVQLRPVQYAFSQLPTPRETLEYALRKFTTLTAGDTVRIEGGGKVWQVKVEAVQPVTCSPAAVSVINTDMSVEFLESVEGPRREDEGEEAKLSEAVAGEVEAEAYHYYRVRVDDRLCGVKVVCQAAEGEPDVYVSTTHSKPSAVACDFKSTAKQRDVLVLPPDGGGERLTSWLYVSVHAYKQKAKYSLLITTFVPSASTASSSLSAVTSSSPRTTARDTRLAPPVLGLASEEVVQPPDTTYCTNCHLYIPNKQYNLHSIQCPRLVVYCAQCAATVRKAEWPQHAHCPECGLVLLKDELEKHVDLTHRSVTCECGAQVDAERLAEHKAGECELRLEVCAFCAMQLPRRAMAAHVEYENARSVPCDKCGQNVSRRRMAIHLATAHGINPSLRPGDRSSMGGKAAGSSTPKSSTQSRGGSGAAVGQEDEMARVMRESRQAAGLTGDQEDEDAVLARVLRESERDAAASAPSADGQAEDVMSDELTAEEEEEDGGDEAEADDEFGDAAEEDSWDEAHDSGTTASSTAAVAPVMEEAAGGATTAAASGGVSGGRRGREPSMCPYCASEFEDYEALIAHMAACDQMED